MKKTVIFLIVLSLSQLQFYCESDPETCTVPATVRDLTGLDGCGWVFELEDGRRIEPVMVFFCGTPPIPKEQEEDPLYNFEFREGKKVLISYTETGSPSICMVGPVVRITCLTEVDVISEE